MKKMKLMLFAVAAIAAASCAKETAPENTQNGNAPELDLIPMTFTAGTETKAVLQSDGTTIHWESDDKIKVYDCISEALDPFTTTEGGKTVTFDGQVTNGSSEYYAVYPSSAASGFDASTKTISIVIPEKQNASVGSVPKNAFISVAKSDDYKNFSFKNLTGFIKFSLKDATDVKSITFSGNKGEAVTGDVKVTISEGGMPSESYGSSMNYTATLEGPFESGKDYYIAVRCFPFEKGITVSAYKHDGTSGSRLYLSSYAKPEKSLARNEVMDIKELDLSKFKSNAPADQFIAYLHGYNVQIGDFNLHKNSGIKPKLLTATTADYDFKAEIHDKENGVLLFLDQEENCSFKIASATNIKGDIKIVGRKSTSKANINMASYFQALAGSLMIKNVDMSMSTTTYITTNHTNSTEDFSHYYLDNCIIRKLESSLMYCSNVNYGITSIYVCNCDIEMAADAKVLFNGSRKTSDFTLKNNVIYNTSENGVSMSLFANGQNGDITNIVITNNTIGNCHPESNGYIYIDGCTTVNITNNLFHIPGYKQYKSILRTKTEDYPKSGTIKTNVSYSPDNTLKACYNTPTSKDVTQEIVARNGDKSMLTTDSDISNGIYKSTNSTYGATR